MSTVLSNLSSEEIYQGSIVTYVAIGTLTAFIWDAFENIRSDYTLCINSRWSNRPLQVYFLSRISTFGFAFSSAIFMTAPTGNCPFFSKLVHTWCPLAISLSALLFLFRVRAIYNGNKFIVSFFSFCWLFVFAASISIPIGSHGAQNGSTKFCKTIASPRYTLMGILSPLAYDTLIFLAISWRMYNSFGVDTAGGMKLVILGKNLPAFSRSLVLDGQRYYLFTVVTGVVVTILAFHPAIPALLRPVSYVPYIVIVNLMGCRVYRSTRLRAIKENQLSTVSGQVVGKEPLYPITFSPPSSTSQFEDQDRNMPTPKGNDSSCSTSMC